LVTLGIRRTFLLSARTLFGKQGLQSMAWLDGIPAKRYTHAFLSSDPQTSVGVRIHENGATLIVASEPEGAMNPRLEYEIPVAEAHHMLTQCKGPRLDRLSRRIRFEQHNWVIDEYLGDNRGLILAHVELMSSDEPFKSPLWLGREVTWDCAYREAHLLRHPHSCRQEAVLDRPLLHPCPFCGCAQSVTLTDTARENLLDPRAWVFQLVRCQSRSAQGASLVDANAPNSGCGAQGPWLDTPKEAAQAWNKRCRLDTLVAQQMRQ
jgi:adenylate cyclase